MDKVAFPLPSQTMCGEQSIDGVLPTVAGYQNPGPTKNLRGVEANTNESKGTPYSLPEISGPRMDGM